MKAQTRRSFLKTSSTIAAGSIAFPYVSRATGSPNEKLNVACIGIGHMGMDAVNHANNSQNLVALCDVDWAAVNPSDWKWATPAEIAARNPHAKKYSDFREMLHDMGDQIDVVTVATPDHTHFAAAMAAMELGINVFVQKPLAHNIWQTRTLQKAMEKYGVQTNMGNQGHTFEGARLIVEWYQAGILGEVREVHCWTDRPILPWFAKPGAVPAPGQPIPEGLHWDLWQGPVAHREYSDEYLPTRWRGWWDYGVGSLGDIGCHTLDSPFWALELGLPTAVDVELIEEPDDDYTVFNAHVIYHFPARGDKPPVTLHWYEGKPRPPLLPGMTKLPGNGMYMIGSEETLFCEGMRPKSPMLWPRENMTKYKDILKKRPLPRVKGGPIQELFRAVQGGPVAGSNFSYSAPLTEVVLLGGLAIRTGKNIEWDAAKMEVTNHPDLERYIKEPTLPGWEYGEDLWGS
ncbi:MAG: Gfo/Idh/MocA family oxidoreductase [Verrucomicrobiota bacterium]